MSLKSLFVSYSLAFILFSSDNSRGQNRTSLVVPTSTRGTVNIILANKQGLVAVTDSKLSDMLGRDHGIGQKLFRIDDHTVCTIAGWFSDPGPTPDGINFPANHAISRVIFTYAEKINRPVDSVDVKAQRIAELVSFTMNSVSKINFAAKIPAPEQTSEITLASFENGQMKIVQINLNAIPATLPLRYSWKEIGGRVVTKDLTRVVRGIPDPAEPLLYLVENAPEDPVIQKYQDKMRISKGESFTLDELFLIATRLAMATAKAHPAQVGEPLQSAEIQDGHLINYRPQVTQTIPDYIIKDRFVILTEMNAHGSHMFGARPTTGGILSIHGGEAIAIASHFTFVQQPLDGILFFNSEFSECDFTYNGSDAFGLDDSNKVSNSTLTLGPDVDPNSDMVRKLLKQFPDLKLHLPAASGSPVHQ